MTQRITTNPKIMVGKPIVRGTRITVELVLRKLAQRLSITDILHEYPQLTEADVQAAIDYAAMVIHNEAIFSVGTDET